jgi:aldehyde dehydrogenase (NAD+)
MATMVETRRKPQIHQTQCFIGGRWVPAASGKTFDTINPATEEVIAQVAEGDAEDVDLAAKAAREAFETGEWSRMDARDRGRLLYKLADAIEENLDELAALESLDNGKPIREAKAADLPLTIDALRYYAGWADKIQGQTIPIRGNFFTYTRREPVGVAGQIIPWNFPMLMVAWKWGPALAAGCTIVMKPAEQTPLTCLRMARLAQKVGFPDGVINVVPGFGPTAGAAVVRHPEIDKVAFTGEHRTAQIIMRDAAENLKRLTFELGGKSPNIVFADANLDAAAAGAHLGIYLNQGQCCGAGSRLFVEDKIYDKFVDKLVQMNESRKIGDPLDPATEAISSSRRSSAASTMRCQSPRTRSLDRCCPSCGSKTSTRLSAARIKRSTAWPPPSGPATCPRRTTSPPRSRPALCGSTATTSSTPPPPSAATKCPAWDASSANEASTPTQNTRR